MLENFPIQSSAPCLKRIDDSHDRRLPLFVASAKGFRNLGVVLPAQVFCLAGRPAACPAFAWKRIHVEAKGLVPQTLLGGREHERLAARLTDDFRVDVPVTRPVE